MEELQQMNVIRFLPEMQLEDMINGSFQHERIVDGDVIHALDSEPTRLTAASHRLVHHVVCDEEVSLELLIFFFFVSIAASFVGEI
jgi:hypothetical protein